MPPTPGWVSVRTRQGGWPGLGRMATGMSRKGFDFQGAGHGADGQRARSVRRGERTRIRFGPAEIDA